MTDSASDLSTGYRLDLLIRALRGSDVRSLLDMLDTEQLVIAHDFLWDKLVELFYMTGEGEFERSAVTALMKPSVQYQKEQKCDLKLEYCKGVECIWSNPECAGNKVKNHIEIMAQVIFGYVCPKKPGTTSFQSEPFIEGEELIPILSHP